MLILVGVTISVALNGGLFKTAQEAATNTIIEAEKEQLLSAITVAYDVETGTINKAKLEANLGTGWSVEGENAPYTVTSPKGNKYKVNANGTIEYAGNGGGQTPGGDTPNPPSGEDGPSTYETIANLPEGVTSIAYKDLETEANADIKTAVDAGKIKAVLKEGDYIAPIPTGFNVSTVTGENKISEGLVINEGANEYVFIPYTSTETYIEGRFGPLTCPDSTSNTVCDSQNQLNYYYGENYYNYAQDFTYAQDKTEIEASINKYKGFYVGRYETTINNDGTIGSQKGATILTAGATIKEGTNPNNKGSYYYRWYGLYKVQKDLYAENANVFSTMITSKEWDTIMSFTEKGTETRATDTYTTQPDLSGSAYSGTTDDQFDLSKNIYDLAGNAYEWTLTVSDPYGRVYRGGSYEDSFSASHTFVKHPISINSYYGSRLTLYIR